jgi:hypothetical protein
MDYMGRQYMETIAYNKIFSSDSWLNVMFMAGLFSFLMYRRDSIVSPTLYKIAWFLFAASLAVPSLIIPVILQIDPGLSGMGVRAQGDVLFLLRILGNAAGPLLLALAMCCFISSVLPRIRRPLGPPAPDRCPLDD